jgi:hypothetical protein
MLVNYGYGHATYSAVPYHPDIMQNKWAVMWGPHTPFHMGEVFDYYTDAQMFSQRQQEEQQLAGGISGHWGMSIQPGCFVKVKNRQVVWDQCNHLTDTTWPQGSLGKVVQETDHDVTIKFQDHLPPVPYDKRLIWVMDPG